MKTMTATEASRSFASVLDEAERGETIVVTRGGRRIAVIGPTSASNGADVMRFLKSTAVDSDFARDVASARESATQDEPAWPDD